MPLLLIEGDSKITKWGPNIKTEKCLPPPTLSPFREKFVCLLRPEIDPMLLWMAFHHSEVMRTEFRCFGPDHLVHTMLSSTRTCPKPASTWVLKRSREGAGWVDEWMDENLNKRFQAQAPYLLPHTSRDHHHCSGCVEMTSRNWVFGAGWGERGEKPRVAPFSNVFWRVDIWKLMRALTV